MITAHLPPVQLILGEGTYSKVQYSPSPRNRARHSRRKLPKPGAGGTRGAQLPVMDAGYPANAGWMAVQVAGMSRISSAQSRVALPGGNRLTSPK
jgi:hypothetical protein